MSLLKEFIEKNIKLNLFKIIKLKKFQFFELFKEI